MPRTHYAEMSPAMRSLMADMIAKRRERNALVAHLMQEPGGLVLAQQRHDGSPMGALVTRSMECPGGWRVTRFDADGFIGHTEYNTRLQAIQQAVQDGYRDTDRDLLHRLCKLDSFRAHIWEG